MALSIEQQVMAYLIQCAIEHRTTTYEEVAMQFDIPTTWPTMSQRLSPILYSIFAWCEAKRLPKLTVLVVRKSGADMALPGKGFWAVCQLPHIDRKERILLTEMYTTDVYSYFEIDANVVAVKPIESEVAYEASLDVWNELIGTIELGKTSDEEVCRLFNGRAEAIYGPNILRVVFPQPRQVQFEFRDPNTRKWTPLKLDHATLERLKCKQGFPNAI